MSHSNLARALVGAGLIKSVRDVKPIDYDGKKISGTVEKVDLHGATSGDMIRCVGANVANRLLVAIGLPIGATVFSRSIVWALTNTFTADGKQIVIRFMHNGGDIDKLNNEGAMSRTIGKRLVLTQPDSRRALEARPNTLDVRPSPN